MSIKRIMMVARYEAKLLRRSWVFLIFAILGVAGVACFQFLIGDIDVTEEYSWSAGSYLWYLRALPSCTPYMNAYLFNFLQALLIVFFVSADDNGAVVDKAIHEWRIDVGASLGNRRNDYLVEYHFGVSNNDVTSID